MGFHFPCIEGRPVKRQIRVTAALAAATMLADCLDESSPSGPDPAVAGTAVLVGAGDIASCHSASGDEATAKLLDGIGGTVFTVGDNAYPDGTSTDYSRCYHPTWGRHRSRTRPALGNHEYHVSGGAAYFSYFGSRAGPSRGYYSYNLGNWHIVVLNSERNLSAQESWLKADLAANPRRCTLAYWHKPLFTSGSIHKPATFMRPLFTILYNAGAEVVVSGHNHHYERFAPQTPYGEANGAKGIRQFIVGTGGGRLYGFTTPKRNSQVRYSGGFGVLKLTLYEGSYSWKFISVPGKSFTDSGSQSCH
jgi:hypothetical protein